MVSNGSSGSDLGAAMAGGFGGPRGGGYAPGPPPYAGDAGREGATLRDYVAVVWRRKWAIAVMAILFTGLAYFISSREAKLYAASATIIFREQQLNLADPLSRRYTDVLGLDREMASIDGVLTSTDLRERMTELLEKGAVDPTPGYSVRVAQQSVDAAAASNVAVITGVSTSPELAAAGANAAAQAYVDWNKDLQRSQISQAIVVIENQLDKYPTEEAKLSTDYIMLKQRLQDLKILEATATGNYRLLASASVPVAPFAPQPFRRAVLGFGVGLFVGIGLAFLLEQFDTRIRQVDEVASVLRQPILGRIPPISSKLLGDTALVTLRHPQGHIAEAFRMVSTNLEFMAVDNRIGSMLVTSCLQGEGKSVAVANLGITMALAGKKVVIVDADLRRPRQHTLFGLDNKSGLSTVATGRTSLVQSMARLDIGAMQDGAAGAQAASNGAGLTGWELGTETLPRIYVLPSGPIPPNPREIVASKRFASIIESLEAEVDLVLVDTPAMLAVSDTSAIAAKVDGVVFLVDLKRVKKPQLYTAADQLFRLPVKMLGVMVRMHGQWGGGHYYNAPYYYNYSYTEDARGKKEKRRREKPAAERPGGS